MANQQDGIQQFDVPRTHAMLGIMGTAAKMNPFISIHVFDAERGASKTSDSKGYSLSELLIGLGLSSIVVAIALSVYQLCRQSWLTISATDALYQNAQVAIRAIRREAELDGAAYLLQASDNHAKLSTPYPSMGNQSEGLVLSHWVGADPFDCQGNSSASTSAMISNSFKRSSNKELTCKDTNAQGSSYQALAEGIEDLQTRFAQINPALNTLQWVNASALFGSAQIVAIEVCLRVATTTRLGVAVKGTLTPTTGCNGESVAADGKLRHVFRHVMALGNRLGAYG